MGARLQGTYWVRLLSVSPPDRPESQSSNVDDPEWIKGLVAKALLQAADEGMDSSAIAPTPVSRPVAAWPELAPLDTSIYSLGRTEGSSVPTSAPVEPRPAPAPPHTEVPEPAAEASQVSHAAATNASSGIVTDAPTAIPKHIAPPGDDVAPAPVPAPLLESITDRSRETAAVTSSPTSSVGVVDAGRPRDAEPASVAPPTAHDDSDGPMDAVMIEAAATTEGFRSSDIRTVLEWLLVIVSALVVALIIKALVLQAFWIPSESMETTVNKGDRILVNKVSYRLHEVRRGDLVVFEKLEGTPGDTKDLIKRAIALPGETIEIRSDGRIWIWGAGETPDDAKLLEEPYLDPQNAVLNAPSASDPLTADIWDEQCTNQPRTPGRCTLGDASYFMMGDNRNRSSDSRFFGPIPEENIVGRAFLRIWPLGELGTL